MKDIKFGIRTEQVTNGVHQHFEEYTNNQADIASKSNHNPYGKSYVDDPSTMAASDEAKITSIPSPYARMHITDIAFRELNAGVGKASETVLAKREISDDYRRAMSHCLDVFEMMFRFNNLDLRNKGITIKRIPLVTTHDHKYDVLLDSHRNLRSYIQTLDLFRDKYMKVINERAENINYFFDFKSLFVFKHKGVTFAASSPFTGFFAKSGCNLAEANISYKGHKFFTNTASEWSNIKARPRDFQKFMYMILKDGLGQVFKHLFEAVKNCFGQDELALLDSSSLAEMYPEFNFGPQQLPQVASTSHNVSFIRPDGLDCSYLKFMLYKENPIDFSIEEEEYKKDIENRVFPNGSGNRVPWMCVNDFLADSLFILPYDINENYSAIDFFDENNNPHRRCLLPIKRAALDYIKIEEATEHLKIKKYDDSHYSVELTLQLTTGGNIVLRRDYYTADQKECNFPNGVLVCGKSMDNFAFGVYPFVKSKSADNIYKVLFYNGFSGKQLGNTTLKFYYYDAQDKSVEFANTAIVYNKTNDASNPEFPVNCYYYNVDER